MGFINIFSKKKEANNQPEQVVEDYYTPVEEPVGELPVGTSSDHLSKFIPENANNNLLNDGFIFDDEVKPTNTYSIETKELIDNNYYLSTPSQITPEVNPTASLFMNNDTNNSDNNDNGSNYGYFDEELPSKEDDQIISNIDGTYSSVTNPTYEENRTGEPKFFSVSLDEINNTKDMFKQNNITTPNIYGNQNIFNPQKIDTSNTNDQNLYSGFDNNSSAIDNYFEKVADKQKVITTDYSNRSDSNRAA